MKIERHRADTGGPRLTSTSGAWTYADPVVHARALRLDVEHGISLPTIDDWIEAQAWTDKHHLQRVLQWRARMLRATSDDAAEGWGMYMLALVALNERSRLLHRLALIGKGVEHKLPPPGEQRTIYNPKRPATTTRALHKRIMAATRAGKSAKEIAQAEGISARTVYRVRSLNR
ncbi:MAG: helix-turn-helix domain-containing protein [Rhodoferax sp.]|nr:helix-turn-helix domain-containing protein [Rhodoferax sp.]